MSQTLDVLIVGAGLSGVGMACHLKRRAPWARFALLEARASLGGTWDLFRYPGVRSDSDMFTLGYAFRPWTDAKAIADGPSILSYVRQTAQEYGVDREIVYKTKVVSAAWSSTEAAWTVEAERYRQKVEKRLGETVLPGLRDCIATSRMLTPLEFHTDLASEHGAAFGLEPILLQSAWFRPHNRSEDVERLYLVGAGTHPGAGLPGVLSSARILDQMVPDVASVV